MKLFKKVIALACAAALCITTLAACGSSGTAPAADTSSKSTAAASTAASSAPAVAPATADGSVTPKVLGTDEIRIAYIPISTAGVTNKIVELAFNDTIDAYKDSGKITVDYFDPGYDAQKQITMVNDAVNQGYNCIFLECADPVSLATPVSDAEKAGIPVITLNLNAETPHTLHIRGVDYLSGWKAAEILAEELGADSAKKVVIIDCPAPMAATNLQSNGFLDYMDENTNWELLDHRNVDNFSQEGANTAMRDILTKYDQIDVVFNMMDDLTTGTLQAIEAAGRNDGSILVYGNMGNPSTFDVLTNGSGDLYGLNFADYYTEYCMAMGFALYYAMTGICGGTLGYTATPEYALTCWPVTPANADLYKTLSRWDLALNQ
jgi:ABC-type sugar transport system substrate-binding protein